MASSLLSAPLYSRIIWFHKYDTKGQGDIDNIAKRIHDALKGIVFADDAAITHTLAIRVDVTADYEILDDRAIPLGLLSCSISCAHLNIVTSYTLK